MSWAKGVMAARTAGPWEREEYVHAPPGGPETPGVEVVGVDGYATVTNEGGDHEQDCRDASAICLAVNTFDASARLADAVRARIAADAACAASQRSVPRRPGMYMCSLETRMATAESLRGAREAEAAALADYDRAIADECQRQGGG